MLLSPLFIGWLVYSAVNLIGLNWNETPEWKRFDVLRYLFLAWLIPFGFRTLRIAFGLNRSSRAALVGVHVAIVWFALHELSYPYFFWTEFPESVSETKTKSAPLLDIEEIFHAQHSALEDVSAKLLAGRPEVADLYFVGFGADASQDVFMHEVSFVRELFDRRFDTAGRSVALVNNSETLDDLPLASASNLSDALHSIGQRMDEEDILFLFLTGHGSKDHELSVRFRNLPLNDIRPERLAEMMVDAGIGWRVVVVSACYSGGFIEALENEKTLILTASAADRKSFGCSDEGDFTYFGRAYFAEQLEEKFDFVAAFEAARERIQDREAQEQKTPSMPQITSAPAILEKLEELATRLRANHT
jgi:hypothetical protein